MLRLALILALLVAIGGLVVSHFVTKPKVDDLNTQLVNTTATLAVTTEEKNKAEADAKTQKAVAEKASRELTDAKALQEAASTEAQQQRGRAERLQTDLTKVTRERNEAQQVLAAWNALGVQPDQVAQIRTDLQKASEERDALTEEKRIFVRNVENLQARLAKYEDRERPVEMPGLKGLVAAVDPQWKFLILDVGQNQGAKERGIVMVRRGDQLVGKARIVTVETNRSIANILPKWQQPGVDVQVGDAVLY
ncbi:MAG TPA: hypothetical protein PLX89_07325 [Verrucomicrobiota bacterium]|nr:hypothetical protein [Verrucomicrobiota bacterium]